MTLNEAQCIELLKEHKAHIQINKDGLIIPQGMIVRYWPEIQRQDLDACMLFLHKYASETNYPNPSQTIASPIIQGHNKRSGTWRQVSLSLEMDPNGNLRLVQVLMDMAAGAQILFASERSTLEDEDTRLYKRTPYAIQSPANSQGNIYQADNTINEDDGTYDARILYRWAKPAQTNFSSTRTAFRRTDEAIYLNQTSAINAPDVTGSGIYQAENSENRFGLYDSKLVYTCGTNTAAALFSAQRSAMEDADRGIYRERNDKVDAPSCGAGGIYDADNSLNDNGTYNSSLVYSRAKLATVAWSSQRTAFRRQETIAYQNTDTPVNAPDVTGSGIYQAANRENRFGLYDSELVYACGTNNAAALFSAQRSSIEDADRGIYREQNQKVDAPSCGAGGIYDADNSLNDNGTYNSSLVYSRAKERITNIVTETLAAGQGTTRTTIYEHTGILPAASNSARNVYAVDVRPNRFGLYDGRIIHEQTAEIFYGPLITQRDENGIYGSTYFYENQDNAIPVPAGSIGSASFRRNPRDNTWDGSLTVRKGGGSVVDWESWGEECWYFEAAYNGRQEENKRLYGFLVYEKPYMSRSSAFSYLRGTALGTLVPEAGGLMTRVVPQGKFRWMSTRLERITL
jgi:hypothetical protein